MITLKCGFKAVVLCTTLLNPYSPPQTQVPRNHVVCMATALYHESRGEPLKGKLWVAKVVLNRGKDPCVVIYTPHQFPWTKGPHTYDLYHYNLARTILRNPQILPNTKATHFHNLSVHPNWHDLKYITTIKNHKFYAKKELSTRSKVSSTKKAKRRGG